MYLLDTNVISELRQGKPKASQAVRTWAAVQPGNQLYLSAVTALEMEIGARRMERRDSAQGVVLRTWTAAILAAFEGRILPFTHLTAQLCAAMHVSDPCAFRDSMIAATAMEHGFTVVTRNVGDFRMAGVQVVNPWEFTPP